MDGRLQPAYIAALVESIETRPPAFVEHLTAALVTRCWPLGDDRDVPRGALRLHEGLPETYSIIPPKCRCDEGHCPICG
jgi:hypothetical protein